MWLHACQTCTVFLASNFFFFTYVDAQRVICVFYIYTSGSVELVYGSKYKSSLQCRANSAGADRHQHPLVQGLWTVVH